jgi:hypothetical protein
MCMQIAIDVCVELLAEGCKDYQDYKARAIPFLFVKAACIVPNGLDECQPTRE